MQFKFTRHNTRPGSIKTRQFAHSLDPDEPVALQIPWWIALRGREGCPAVERAIIYASGIRWRKRLEQLATDKISQNGEPKSWADVARVIRIHLSNLTGKGRTTHLSLVDVLLVAGMLGVPCAELIPESYSAFIKDATSRLCYAKTQDEDLMAYAAYWAFHPKNPRAGVDRSALNRCAEKLGITDRVAESAVRGIAQKLEKHLQTYRSQVESMLADGRLP